MALILNIETSSENCSVAISKDGVATAAAQSSEIKSHASILTVLIEDLFRKNSISVKQLDAIAVSKGPGSYTGLRIGVSVAKGLCYGARKPLIAVNTLESMMHGFKHEIMDFNTRFDESTIFYPMLDARRQEVYMASFSKNAVMIRETTAEIIQEDSFNEILRDRNVVFFGSGADKCRTLITHKNAIFMDGFTLKAEYLAKLTEEAFNKELFEDIAYFEPYYLKDFVATVPKRKVI